MIENAATWHSYGRWNAERGLFSAVVYGDGNRFVDGIRHLQEILNEFGGTRPVLYFGDLDAAGIQIPLRASTKAAIHGLPRVEPHLPSYRWLLELGRGRGVVWEAGVEARRKDCEWLGEFSGEAWKVLSAGQRLAQERVSLEFLQSLPVTAQV